MVLRLTVWPSRLLVSTLNRNRIKEITMFPMNPGVMPYAAILAACILFSAPLQAQEDSCGVERDVRVAALDEQTWKRMNDVY